MSSRLRYIWNMSSTQPPDVKVTQAFTGLECLPTELIEQIASELMTKYEGCETDRQFLQESSAVVCTDLLAFRLTSRTIHAKTQHSFSQCFQTHVVVFNTPGCLKLLHVANNAMLRPVVRHLIFIASGTKEKTLEIVAKAPKLLYEYPIDTAILIVAMKKLDIRSIWITPKLGSTKLIGLKDILTATSNLTRLVLSLDKASADHIWRHQSLRGSAEPARRLWRVLASLHFWKLEYLRLSGWFMSPKLLEDFLVKHAQTLTSLHLDRCFLSGAWVPVLARLQASPTLRTMQLSQISQNWWRVVFPRTSIPQCYASDFEKGWQIVSKGYGPEVLIEPWQDWATRLHEILVDLRTTNTRANPAAPDALRWFY
ncbi:hypothetical protein P153DRAFT_404484 [Dothidotthia symphoricarpi CBS 119687]|uniref:Uncharacterized protein n=1 Tax=Dothidotthia symphoricarpi CBS 119687 TaxID=1392245 RepID=A0A6A6A8Y2_9PLEO|nr:uncharacterized protein P153DRAFT_404484 [Dothidotthia symphoricarpi CBS 119687]KAF2128422.1 hypothetical protein P153DRAFT_404484 [Dothidotthia symphoricarpi CBS 119687]